MKWTLIERHAGCFGKLMLSTVRSYESFDDDDRCYDSHRLPMELRRALIMFAEHTRAAADAASYLERRWRRYPEVRVSYRQREIEAFTLVQPFHAEGARHLYVGPMFSRGGTYIDLFARLVRELLSTGVGLPFHLAAEIEHPRVLHAFNVLFPSCASTARHASSVNTVRVAQRFLAHVPHIGKLDLVTLQTAVDEPLFVERCTTTPSAQLVVVSCDGSARARRALGQQVEHGLVALGRRLV